MAATPSGEPEPPPTPTPATPITPQHPNSFQKGDAPNQAAMPPGPNPAAPVPGLVPPQPDVNAVQQYALEGAEVSTIALPQKAHRCLITFKIRRQMTKRRCGQGFR